MTAYSVIQTWFLGICTFVEENKSVLWRPILFAFSVSPLPEKDKKDLKISSPLNVRHFGMPSPLHLGSGSPLPEQSNFTVEVRSTRSHTGRRGQG